MPTLVAIRSSQVDTDVEAGQFVLALLSLLLRWIMIEDPAFVDLLQRTQLFLTKLNLGQTTSHGGHFKHSLSHIPKTIGITQSWFFSLYYHF
jgi:hypothetical protein